MLHSGLIAATVLSRLIAKQCVLVCDYSEVLGLQSSALDYIYRIHSAATNVEFAQQMAVSYCGVLC